MMNLRKKEFVTLQPKLLTILGALAGPPSPGAQARLAAHLAQEAEVALLVPLAEAHRPDLQDLPAIQQVLPARLVLPWEAQPAHQQEHPVREAHREAAR